MSLDTRIEPKARPMFGCHSDLDQYRNGEINSCAIDSRSAEKACDGCSRREQTQDDQPEEMPE